MASSMRSRNGTRRWKKLRATLTALVLTASATLSCASSPAVLPDPAMPHRVADEVEVWVWVRGPDGVLVRTRARVMPGWWVVSPQVAGG